MELIEEPYRYDLVYNCNSYASDGVELFGNGWTYCESTSVAVSYLRRLTCQLGQFQESENLVKATQHIDLWREGSTGPRSKDTSHVRQL